MTKVKLTAAQKRELIEKGQRNKPGPKPGSKRKPATDPPPPVAQEPPETPPPVTPDPPEPVAPVAQDPPPPVAIPQLTEADIMNEIDATFKAHNEALTVQQAQTPIPVAETPANGTATQQNTIPANPVNPAAQVAQAGNAANEALTRLIDPELIVLSCDLLLSNLLTVLLRKVAKFDVKQKDFALTGAERRDIGTLLDAWMKTRQKSIMSPGAALVMGIAGVYSGKSISLIGAEKIKPVAPPPVQIEEPGTDPGKTMSQTYQDTLQAQNNELLNTLRVMQSKIEQLDKRVTSQAKKRPANKNASKKGTVVTLNKAG